MPPPEHEYTPHDISALDDIYYCPCGRHHRGSMGAHSLNGPRSFSSRTFNLLAQTSAIRTSQDTVDEERRAGSRMLRSAIRRNQETGHRAGLQHAYAQEHTGIEHVQLRARVNLLPAGRIIARLSSRVQSERMAQARHDAALAHELDDPHERRAVHRARRQAQGTADGLRALAIARTQADHDAAVRVARVARVAYRGVRAGQRRRRADDNDDDHDRHRRRRE